MLSGQLASTTRGRGSRPRTDRHRRSSDTSPSLSLGDHRGEVEADRPSFGPRRSPRRPARSDARRGPPRRSARRPPRPGPGRWPRTPPRHRMPAAAAGAAARSDSPRPVASRRGIPEITTLEHIVTGRRPQFVKVVEHQHERHRARPERRGQARRGAAQRRHAETAHVGDQIVVARRDPRVRGRQQGQQGRGIVVEAGPETPRRPDDPPPRPIRPAASTCRNPRAR